MSQEEDSKLTLKQLSLLTKTESGEFTVFGWKCGRSDGVVGWVLISETNDDDRLCYWVTDDMFYLIRGITVTAGLFSSGASVFESGEPDSDPEMSRKEAMLTAISKWEEHPDLHIKD